jgi:hypothetical protein
MKIVKCKFSIATQYVKSSYSEHVKIEVEDDATEQEIEQEVEETYRNWLEEHNYGAWSIIEQ